MSETKCTFERVIRDCPHNKQMAEKGVTRGLLCDFKILLNGQHAGWWYQYGANGSCDTKGYRYWLKDKTWANIRNGLASRDDHPIAARNREEFESVLLANLNRIPSDDELAQRKLDAERKEQTQKAAEDARKKLDLLEKAAPDMLVALKSFSLFSAMIGKDGRPSWFKDDGAWTEFVIADEYRKAAIAKAGTQ